MLLFLRAISICSLHSVIVRQLTGIGLNMGLVDCILKTVVGNIVVILMRILEELKLDYSEVDAFEVISTLVQSTNDPRQR